MGHPIIPEDNNANHGPVALVTGASKGIGLAVATMMVHQKCRVVANYGHDDAAAKNAASLLRQLGGDVTWVKSDLSTMDGIDSIVRAVDTAGGRITYFISNVGVTDKTPFGDVTFENWEWVLRTNLTIPFFLTQALASKFVDQKSRIVFIGTTMGIRPHSISYSYGASKAGLHFLAQCLVKAMAPRGITVNVVAPGFVETSMQRNKSPEHRSRVENKIALRRFARTEEVATVVDNVLHSNYMTGQVIGVDGGYDFE